MNPVESACAPIAGENPCGEDIRMDPVFDQLQDELTISPSSTSQKGINWEHVVQVSSGILETRSKDLLVAAYLSVGLLHTRGIPDGLLDSVTVLREMLEKFWDGLFPPLKRMRGRTQALSWWNDKTQEYLRNIEPDPLDPEIQAKLDKEVNTLFDLVSDKCPDAPSLRSLLEYVRSLPVTQTAVAEPPPDEEKPAQSAPATPSPKSAPAAPRQESAAPPSILANMDDFNNLLSDVTDKQYRLVDFMIKLNPQPTTEPVWYHLNLLNSWLSIKKQPPANDGKTLIPPPDSGIINSLASMKAVTNWPGIIKSACYTIRRYPFWLDMNRYTAEALKGLGSQYADAVSAISNDTVAFVQRLKGIEGYTFSDGTPFADSDTRSWLDSIACSSAPAQQQPLQVTGDEIGVKVAEGYSRCREMFATGRQADGLSTMQQMLQESASARERCLWRLSMLRLLGSAGMEKLAIPHLNELMRDFDRYQIETWEPPLALDILRTAWTILNSQKDDESRKRADEILSRISMLSPSEALKLMK